MSHPGAAIAVSGHSLGGALATHALIDLIRVGYKVDHFYTYGSPRMGDTAFRNFVQELYPNNFRARLVNSHDPVPHLPLESWGY
jgi:predicted lipase